LFVYEFPHFRGGGGAEGGGGRGVVFVISSPDELPMRSVLSLSRCLPKGLKTGWLSWVEGRGGKEDKEERERAME
jgi:hypothetical protein